MSLHRVIVLAILSLLTLSPRSWADENLHGKWEGASAWNKGEVLIFEASGRAKLDGEAFQWRVPKEGHIVYSFEGLDLEMTYTIRKDKLTLRLEGERITYRRVGPKPAPKPKPQPKPEPEPSSEKTNPLAKPKALPKEPAKKDSDPFARRFEGDGLILELRATTKDSYKGSLSFGGETWPVECRRSGSNISGTFGEDQAVFPFSATLSGDKLSLESGENSFNLTGEAQAKSAGPAIPPAMTGVAKGKTKAWEHPRKWFSMDLPRGWDVTHADDEVVYVNPGFKQGDAQNAIILMTFGGLGKAEKSMEVDALMNSQERDFKQFFDQQQIAVTKPDGPAEKVLVGEVPGAIQTWKGTVQGTMKVDIWVGSIIKRDAFLTTIAIMLGDEADKFLPGIKQTYMSLRPTPPELNPGLMAATAGRTLVLNLSGSGGTFITKYEFSAGGNVHRTTMVGGITGDFDVGGESQLSGTYEIIGDELYMYFKDGQEGGQIVLENGQPTHVKMGSDTARFQ